MNFFLFSEFLLGNIIDGHSAIISRHVHTFI